MNMNIKIYGADWCSDCVIVKNFLDEKKIPYDYVICTDNEEVMNIIEKANNGKRIIPTIDIDGKIYSNPGITVLMKIIS